MATTLDELWWVEELPIVARQIGKTATVAAYQQQALEKGFKMNTQYFPAISKDNIEEFRAAWCDKSSQEQREFYERYSFKDISHTIGGSLSSDSTYAHTYSSKDIKGWLEDLIETWSNGCWSNFKHSRRETPNKHELRLFFLMNDFKYIYEFIKYLREITEFSFEFTSDGRWMGGCSTRHWYLGEEYKKPKIASLITEKNLREALKDLSVTGEGTPSGYVMSVPTVIFKKYSKIFSNYRYKKVFETSNGFTTLFKVTLSRPQREYVKENNLKYRLKPHAISFSTERDVSLRTGTTSSTDNFHVYKGFYSDKSTVNEKESFADSSCEYDMLVLRDFYTDGERRQIQWNRAACEHHGFKPLLGDDMSPYLNSSYTRDQRWVLPMFRRNPHFEEDK